MPGEDISSRYGPFDRIVGVEHRRECARGHFAILDRHAAVRPFGHDLQRAAVGGGNAHAHQPVAEIGEHRLGERGDARRPSRLGDQPRLFGKGCRPVVHAGEALVLEAVVLNVVSANATSAPR